VHDYATSANNRMTAGKSPFDLDQQDITRGQIHACRRARPKVRPPIPKTTPRCDTAATRCGVALVVVVCSHNATRRKADRHAFEVSHPDTARVNRGEDEERECGFLSRCQTPLCYGLAPSLCMGPYRALNVPIEQPTKFELAVNLKAGVSGFQKRSWLVLTRS